MQVVIGMEGLWGTLLTLTIVYPVAYMIPGMPRRLQTLEYCCFHVLYGLVFKYIKYTHRSYEVFKNKKYVHTYRSDVVFKYVAHMY